MQYRDMIQDGASPATGSLPSNHRLDLAHLGTAISMPKLQAELTKLQLMRNMAENEENHRLRELGGIGTQ